MWINEIYFYFVWKTYDNEWQNKLRERAEAGVFLLKVLLAQKQNTELPLNASEQDRASSPANKKHSSLMSVFYFVWKGIVIANINNEILEFKHLNIKYGKLILES